MPKTFFHSPESESKTQVRKPKLEGCAACGLEGTCHSPHMAVTGEGLKETVVICEAPGAEEDARGEQLVGAAGNLFRNKILDRGLELNRDFFKDNALCCFISPKVRVYTPEGYKFINKINVGDLVLTHTGRFQRVISRTHDLSKKQRKYEGPLCDVVFDCSDNSYSPDGQVMKYTVTSDHRFLSEEEWVYAKDLVPGQSIRALGQVCEVCGRTYFQQPKAFDTARHFCSPRCHNNSIANSNSSPDSALSRYMIRAYKDGLRDGKSITEHAHQRVQELMQSNPELKKRVVDSLHSLSSREKAAQAHQQINNFVQTITTGFGEPEFADYCHGRCINYVSQYPIGIYNYDFLLVDYNLLVEIDNPERDCQRSVQLNHKIKDQVAEKNGYQLIRVSSGDPISSVERLLKNHRKEYVFVDVRVKSVTIRPQKRQAYLYCLEVEGDASFVGGGVVSHNCRPPENAEPKPRQLKACRDRLEKNILEKHPKFIWLMGGAALDTFYADRDIDQSKVMLGSWVRWAIPDRKYNAWVFPMYHPSAINRTQDKNLEAFFDINLKWAISCLGRERPVFEDYESKVVLLERFEDIVGILKRVKLEKPVVFIHDYETSGTKPYYPGHKIHSISFFFDGFAYAFALDYPGIWSPEQRSQIVELWGLILEDPEIGKAAHSINMENQWARAILHKEVQGWKSCTMTNVHILDSRPGITGLKMQVFLRWGVEGYEKEIKPYMEGRSLKDPHFNRLDEFPLKKLLLYNGLDSFFTNKLYWEQDREFERSPKQAECRDLFTAGVLTMAELEYEGIPINMEYYVAKQKEMTLEREGLIKRLRASDEAQQFQEIKGKPLDLGKSGAGLTNDIKYLFLEIMHVKSEVRTAIRHEVSINDKVLSRLDSQFAKDFLRARKLKKLLEYVENYIAVAVDGKLHPSFPLHLVRTGRGCIAEGTKIEIVRDLSKTPGGIPIEQVKSGDLIYSVDDHQNLILQKVKWAGLTGLREVIRIHWLSKSRKAKGFLDVTPEHLVHLTDGRYIKAEALTDSANWVIRKSTRGLKAASVTALHRAGDRLYVSGHQSVYDHHFVYEQVTGDKLKVKELVHHNDGEHFNNMPENLQKIVTLGLHTSYHSFLYFQDENNRKKLSDKIRQGKRDGSIPQVSLSGFAHPNSLKLSRFSILKLMAKSKGKLTKLPYDFNTMKTYLRKYNLDSTHIKLRYGSDGTYVSKNVIVRVLSNLKISEIFQRYKLSYSKIMKLSKIHEVNRVRKWSNQYGSFVPNNHYIVKVEKMGYSVNVYDIEVEGGFPNFFANEVCVHNSSSDPNFQNVPKRDKQGKKVTRSGIIPSPGNELLEVDFSGFEVRGNAIYSHDPELIRYIEDESTDMHRDIAMDIFILSVAEVTDDLRQYAKNGFVFAQFYGDWYVDCARVIWEGLQAENHSILKHLREKGIKSLVEFERHMKTVEGRFWSRLAVTRQWREDILDFYRRRGYIDTFFGFRESGYLRRNQIWNMPVQSTCFHILLWCAVEINKIRKAEGWKTKIIGQIHDALLLDLDPAEKKHVIEVITYITQVKTREVFPWIIVPLVVDFKSFKDSWYDESKVEDEFLMREDEDEAV